MRMPDTFLNKKNTCVLLRTIHIHNSIQRIEIRDALREAS